MAKKREITLAGFDVWHAVDYNSAWETVADLDIKLAEGWELKKVKVPVSWQEAFASVAAHLSNHTELVVCLGMARNADRVLLEQRAKNRVNLTLSDVEQRYHHADVIYCDAPESYESPLPVNVLSTLLEQKNIPVQVSNDAGDYLCNHLFYSLLHHVALVQHNIWVGFVHVPPYEESGGLPRAMLLEAIEVLLNSLIEQRQGRLL